MIVEYNDITCNFVDLWTGDAFVLYENGEKHTCMKINGLGDGNNLYVYLASGEVFKMDPHQKVERVNARVVVG